MNISIFRILVGVLAGGAILYISLGCALYFNQAAYIYFPTREIEATPQNIGIDYQDVWLDSENGIKIHGWFVPAKGARGTMLFFHGNGGNISHRLDTIRQFHSLDLNFFIIDYRGYGKSGGRPNELGTYRDAMAAWNWLIDEQEIPADTIIVAGRSLGGSIAAWLAKEVHPAAAIVESSFSSIPDIASEIYPLFPVRLLARYRYPTIDYVRIRKCPLLVIHSVDDDIIPYHHGEKIFDAANSPKEFLQIRGSHNDGIFVSAETYESGIRAFLEKYFWNRKD